MDQRPVLGPAGHPGRGQPDGDLPAFRAFLRGDLVLGHRRRRRRRGLEDLPLLRGAQHRLAREVMAAAAARGRAAQHRLLRVRGLPQRGGLRAGLLPRPAPGRAAQRPVPRLFLVRAVRRGRLRRRARVLVQPPPQLLYLRGQRGDLRVPRGQLRRCQLIPVPCRLPEPRVNVLQLRDPRTQPRHFIGRGHMRRIGHEPHYTTAHRTRQIGEHRTAASSAASTTETPRPTYLPSAATTNVCPVSPMPIR